MSRFSIFLSVALLLPASAAANVRVATYNIGDGPDAKKVASLRKLADEKKVTVIGLQEASDRKDVFARFIALRPAWSVYQPKAAGGPAVPILWDHSVWRLIKSRSVLAVPKRFLGPKGAGPTSSKAKRINILLLERRGKGRPHRLRVFNTHLIPSARRTDLSAQEKANRRRHVRDHVAALAREIGPASKPVAVAVTGDFNGPGGWDLLTPLKDIGLTGFSPKPTHKTEALDHVLARGLTLKRFVRVHVASDHWSVMRVLAPTPH
jgi:endonuclease/exonuclease/phosphatase family protein